MRYRITDVIFVILTACLSSSGVAAVDNSPVPASSERMVEWTIHSSKTYSDPFNDVEVDVVFTDGRTSWRVPTFWRGGNAWTVRFAPPSPGKFFYHLESSDRHNPDLNGHGGQVIITPYRGNNDLLRHGMIRVSSNHRYFEQTDGTPFFWLGDTWWSGLSTRLSWEDFQQLTNDRKAKGFTVVQLVAGLVPTGEEVAPIDPGDRDEGGAVWDKGFKQINPAYFDYADRRLQILLESGIVPAIVGGWRGVLAQMGTVQMKKHWRYIIARYGAYPVFWIAGGEVFDPPPAIEGKLKDTPLFPLLKALGWTDVVRYIRATDPYHHPLTVHECDPPYDSSIQDESLTDFDMFQAGHHSWPSVATEVALLDTHYSRVDVIKPLVVGEVGYEELGGSQLEDFQRMAYWLGMLNGAAGQSYGAVGTWMSYTADKPIERVKFSFMTWREGMRLPGSQQIGLGASLLRQFEWWKFEPHPEWVAPRGTTLLEPHHGFNGGDIDLIAALSSSHPPPDDQLPLGEWHQHHGDIWLPYAAGIPRKVRFVFMPYFGFGSHEPPTILGLEDGVRYHAYYWDTTLGIKFDLGVVERQLPGAVIAQGHFDQVTRASLGSDAGLISERKLVTKGTLLDTVTDHSAADVIVAVDAMSTSSAGILLRFKDMGNYLVVVYSPREKTLYLSDSYAGAKGPHLGLTTVGPLGSDFRLSAEVRGDAAVASVTDGKNTYTTPIVNTKVVGSGLAGVLHEEDGQIQEFDNFEMRASPTLESEEPLQRKLYDGLGIYRGDLSTAPGGDWKTYGTTGRVLLDAYKPDRLPYGKDWLLILDADAHHEDVNREEAKVTDNTGSG